MGNRAVDILQVVDARSADNNLLTERTCARGSGRPRSALTFFDAARLAENAAVPCWTERASGAAGVSTSAPGLMD